MSQQDWDLWAVVKSCSSQSSTNHVSPQLPLDNSLPVFTPPNSFIFEPNHDDPFNFLNDFGSRKRKNNGFDELGEVYETFFANSTNPNKYLESLDHGGLNNFNANAVKEDEAKRAGSTPNIRDKYGECKGKGVGETLGETNMSVKMWTTEGKRDGRFYISIRPHSLEVSTPNIREEYGGYQKKRNQRTITVEVKSENLHEVDPWNWRKYGRKPIKASPYPRNYYKCSSEGNKCQAKKIVEISQSDPEKLRVSYSGEHHHPPPCRRHGLSCTSRKKSSTIAVTKKEAEKEDSYGNHPHGIVKVKEEVYEDGEDKNSESTFMDLQDLGGGIGSSGNGNFDWSLVMNDDFGN